MADWKKNKTKKRRRPISFVAQKIWIRANGPIPKDLNGRIYEIHHKDGDPFNNELDNLQALTIADHYEVHFQKGDLGAAWAIAMRMKEDPEEYRKRVEAISVLRRGKDHGWGWKISLGLTGKKLTPEHRKNLSESHKGLKPSIETRAKMSASRKGIIISVETRLKRSIALKGRVMGPEWRAKMSAAKKGKSLWPNGRSAEDIEKIKAGHARRMAQKMEIEAQ